VGSISNSLGCFTGSTYCDIDVTCKHKAEEEHWNEKIVSHQDARVYSATGNTIDNAEEKFTKSKSRFEYVTAYCFYASAMMTNLNLDHKYGGEPTLPTTMKLRHRYWLLYQPTIHGRIDTLASS
jgi:hypothetical protein